MIAGSGKYTWTVSDNAVGWGKYSYNLVENWLNVPDNIDIFQPSDLAVDSNQRIFLLHRGEPPVVVFDQDGNFLESWGHHAFNRPHGIVIVEDVVYLADSDDSVVMLYTLDGKPLKVIGKRGEHSNTGGNAYGELACQPGGPFNHPCKLFPSPWGDLYVADGEINCQVHKYTHEGEYLGSWGNSGKNVIGEFHMVHGIWVTEDEKLYICDRENARIQIVTKDFDPIALWSGPLRGPTDIVADDNEIFYVSQFGFHVSHRYTAYPAPEGCGTALMNVDRERMVHPNAPPQVTVLNKRGKVLTSWVTRKAHGLCVDADGNIYLALEDDNTVDKYALQS
jgi:hypothetical protein